MEQESNEPEPLDPEAVDFATAAPESRTVEMASHEIGPPAPSEPSVERSLAYLSETAGQLDDEAVKQNLEQSEEVLESPSAFVGPPAPPAASGSFVFLGQICLALSFALLSEPFQLLLPWRPQTSGMLATFLFLAAMATLFRPLAQLVDEVRRQTPGWSERLQHAAALMAVGGGLALAFVSFAGNASAPSVTPETVRQTVLDWADRSGFNAQPEPATPAYFFAYTLHLDSDLPVTVSRTKARPNDLTVAATLRLSGEHRGAFSGMAGGQQEQFRNSLQSELGDGVEIRFELPNAVHVEQQIPIKALSRATFHQAVLDADAALARVRSKVQGR
ncbi:MAG: hypothetical protein R2748_32135 [Bryobacterales bacterium]